MARVAYGPLVTSISGKVGNVVFSKKGNSSPYIKTLQTKTTNPSSANQATQRNYFSQLSKSWQGLSASQQAVWTDAEKNGYGKRADSGGGAQSIIHANKGKGGGKGLYMYINQNRLRTGGTALNAPVSPAVVPANPGTLSATCASGTITTTWTAPVAGLVCQQWIVGVGKNIHRQVAADTVGITPISPATIQTESISNVNGAKGAEVPLSAYVGQKVYLQAEMIDPASGLASNPTNTVQVLLA